MSFVPVHLRIASSCGAFTGIVCSINPFTAVNSAVVAPMPMASDSRTTTVHPLVRSNMRSACLMS